MSGKDSLIKTYPQECPPYLHPLASPPLPFLHSPFSQPARKARLIQIQIHLLTNNCFDYKNKKGLK